MAFQLTGITGRGGNSSEANRADRKTDLQNKIAQNVNLDAKGILIRLKDGLQGAPRNGFLRLDGSGATGDVSFSTHSWKGWGKSAKGEVTGAALKALFEKAGYDTGSLEAYLKGRSDAGHGNERISSVQVRELIIEAIRNSALKQGAILNSSPESTIQTGALIGKGGLGSVVAATFQGKQVVYKTLNQSVDVTLDPSRLNKGSIQRGGEVTATYLANKVRGITAPTHFVVSETRADGSTQEHVVKGGASFRRWVTEMMKPSEGRNISIFFFVNDDADTCWVVL
jgi:hypothetical protein